MAISVYKDDLKNEIRFLVNFKDEEERISEVKFEKDKRCYILSSKKNVYVFNFKDISYEATEHERIAYNIKELACGKNIVIYLSVSGNVYYNNSLDTKSKLVNLKGKHVKVEAFCEKLIVSKIEKSVFSLNTENNNSSWVEYAPNEKEHQNPFGSFPKECMFLSPIGAGNLYKFTIEDEEINIIEYVSCRNTRILISTEGKVFIMGEDFYGLQIGENTSTKRFIKIFTQTNIFGK